MASAKANPFSVLDSSLGEVLVQTGKALKAYTRDESGSIAGAGGVIRHRSQEASKTYHLALDDIEGEILQAKAALQRDLTKLRNVRAPPPPSTPPPEPQHTRLQELKHEPTKVAEAPMLDMPSTAAHTMTHQAYVPEPKMNPVVPFPDMGSGMSSSDILSVTNNETKATSRVPTASMQSAPVITPQLKAEAVPSPVSGLTARNAEGSVTQRSGMPLDSRASDQSSENVPVPIMFDLTADSAAGANGGNSDAPKFTNMQFSLDTSASGVQNAPPAPMPAFDMSTFSGTGSQGEFPDGSSFDSMNNDLNMSNSTGADKGPRGEDKSLDDVFNLDGGADGMELDLDLGNGVVNDSTFDELFLDTGDNAGMGQFDNAFFGLD